MKGMLRWCRFVVEAILRPSATFLRANLRSSNEILAKAIANLAKLYHPWYANLRNLLRHWGCFDHDLPTVTNWFYWWNFP